VKTTLCALAFVVALTLTASAAQKKPVVSQHRAGNGSVEVGPFKDSPSPAPPALCSPCLFYGGDINTGDINAAGMSDENTVLIPGSQTYGSMNVPTGVTATVWGIVFNVQASAAFDPMTANYDIRTGVSEGNGGTSLASGTATMRVQSTGRNFLGLNEYTIGVTLPTAVVLTPGEYWFNVEPTCTGSTDGSCGVFRQFVSNTTGETNNLRGSWQPVHQMYLNSSFFGFTWANWCDSSLGFNVAQCAGLSFGVIGTE
jgi:hypothetical protein